MGKTKDIFKKIGDFKGTFLAKTGIIKDKNGKDLKEAEEIKMRWVARIYRKDYTSIEPDILGG